MTLDEVTPGCPLEIVGEEEKPGQDRKEEKIYKSSLYSVLDQHSIEINAPTEQMTLVPLHPGEKYDFRFLMKNGFLRAPGVIRDRYRREQFQLLKVELEDTLTRFQRREFFRLDCMFPVTIYALPYPAESMTPEIMHRVETGNFPLRNLKTTPAVCLDISGGGMRLTTNQKLPEAGSLALSFSLSISGKEEKFTVLSEIVESVKIEGMQKYSHRVHFLFYDRKIQESVVRYIFEVERYRRQRNL